jgi:phosphoglycolate phosphatase/pyrophosphatase PpaX
MHKKYKLFIFDFDGTLGDTKECVVSSFQKSLLHNNIPIIDKSEIIHYMGLSLPEVFKKLTHAKFIDSFYKKLVADYRIFYKEFLTSKTQIFPEVAETLKILKEKKVLCTIATSKKTEFAITSCKYLEIDKYIDFYIGDDMVINKKPDPEMVIVTLKRFNIDVKDAVMVGDSTFDIEMGNALMMDTVGVTWGAHSKELLTSVHPTYLINEFPQLLNLILN